jgi:hypothetical protein
MNVEARAPAHPRPALIIGGYVFAALAVFAMWALDTENDTAINLYSDRTLAGMVHGTAGRPVVLRALIPWCVRGIMAVLPDSLEQGLSSLFFDGAGPAWRAQLHLQGIDAGHVVDYLLVMLSSFASLLGFMFAQRALLRAQFAAPAGFAELGPFAAIAILPGFFKAGTHLLYDFPALFLAVMLCLALAHRQLVAFYVFLALAVLNKETALLFTLLFARNARHWLPRKRLFVHLASQLAMCAALRGVVCSASPTMAARWSPAILSTTCASG